MNYLEGLITVTLLLAIGQAILWPAFNPAAVLLAVGYMVYLLRKL